MDENNDKPLVSIITVCYNSEKYISDTIESVLNQTYDNIEYIIVDGESTDNTLDIIKEYEPKFNGRMRWVSESDNGIYDAMNKGIEMANGKIIGIINSDDWYDLNAVKIVVNEFFSNKAKVVYGDMYKWDLNNSYFFKGNITRNLNKNFNLNHPTIFIKKSVYNKYGKFDTTFPLGADKDLILRLLNNDVTITKINSVLANFRFGGVTSRYSIKFILKKPILYFKLLRKNDYGYLFSFRKAILKFLRSFRNYILSKIFSEQQLKKLKEIKFNILS